MHHWCQCQINGYGTFLAAEHGYPLAVPSYKYTAWWQVTWV